jgi:hypothetical protein
MDASLPARDETGDKLAPFVHEMQVEPIILHSGVA